MAKSVPQALADLGALYEERNKLYDDNYLHFGKILVGLFPRGLTLTTEEEFNRFALFLNIVHKTTRYANAILKGGHVDSLDDIAVYAQMTQETDGLMAEKRLKETFEKAAYFDPEKGEMVKPDDVEYKIYSGGNPNTAPPVFHTDVMPVDYEAVQEAVSTTVHLEADADSIVDDTGTRPASETDGVAANGLGPETPVYQYKTKDGTPYLPCDACNTPYVCAHDDECFKAKVLTHG